MNEVKRTIGLFSDNWCTTLCVKEFHCGLTAISRGLYIHLYLPLSIRPWYPIC